MMRFTVFGLPTPKGSTRSFVVTPKAGGPPRAVTTHDNPKTKGWQQTIAQGAAVALQRPEHARLRFEAGGVLLELWFYLPRPKALLTKRLAGQRIWHTKKPDLDKLARAAKDALTGVIWTDDSQVVDLVAHKRYCAAGEFPRAVITVRQADL